MLFASVSTRSFADWVICLPVIRGKLSVYYLYPVSSWKALAAQDQDVV